MLRLAIGAYTQLEYLFCVCDYFIKKKIYTRHTSSDIHSDVLGSTNLFFIPNPAWKIIRARLTPFFTSGKLKQMFHLMKHIGNEMNDTLSIGCANGKFQTFATDIKDILARYTTGSKSLYCRYDRMSETL